MTGDDDRQVLWDALTVLAPAGTTPTWLALGRAAGVVGVDEPLLTALSCSPPDAVPLEPGLLRAAASAAHTRALGVQGDRAHALMRRQGGAVGGLLLVLLLAAAGVLGVIRALDPVDLAKGKPWRASSSWGACDPDRGVCGALRSRVFFHTLDDASPWVEIDLQAPTRFSSLTIVNRSDEQREERAVPLVAEVSDDQQSWKQIARRDQVFSVWKPRFEPVTARFLRLRIDRRSWLHLEAVKVHP